jgi:uncharacterized protein YkwD
MWREEPDHEGEAMTLRLTGATLVALFVLLTLAAGSAAAFDRDANEATMLQLVNHARACRGLATVKGADPLHRAARDHSRDMIDRDYFSHSSLAGATVAARARRAGYSRGDCSQWAVGEVIAWGQSCRGTPESVFRGWMRSSPHRKVILGRRWRDVGIGCARGTYKGMSGVVMYTIDLGRRVQ